MTRQCSHEGCRLPVSRLERCAYHTTEQESGEKWARLCHPNSPANPDYKERSDAEDHRR